MSARARKIAGDLRESPARAILVGIAILVGTLAVSASFGARAILSREVAASYRATNPTAAVLWLDAVDGDLVARAAQRPGVQAAEARRLVRTRVEVAPGEFRSLVLLGVDDFRNLRVSTFRSVSGAWPPAEGELLLERSSLPVLRVAQGGTLRVRAPGGASAELRVSGLVHDPGVPPGWMDDIGFAYATPGTLARLGQGGHLDELRITVGDAGRDRAARTAAELAAWLAAEGHPARRVEVPPRKHPHADQMSAVLALLQAFSALALALSGALAANVMAALLGRQVRQVGILKAIGATSAQVARIYLGFVLLLASGAVILGVPAGALAARAFATFAAEQLNIEIASSAIPLQVLGLEALLGLGVPLLGAAIPVLRAARMTAREAIQHAGVSAPAVVRGAASGRAPLRPMRDRTVILAARNVFRRPVRLALALGALALGGAALMTAVNVYGSLLRALDEAMAARGDDVEVRLLSSAPARELIDRALGVPGVRSAEAWGRALAAVELPGAAPDRTIGSDRYELFAPPTGTRLLGLRLAEGRWPSPGELGAVVVNGGLRNREEGAGLRLGASIALLSGGRRTPARVVGVVEEIGEFTLYTNARTLEAVTGEPNGVAAALRVVADPGAQREVAAALERAVVDGGWFPTHVMARDARRKVMADHFLIIVGLLVGAALTAVVVGGLGLATSMSLNVLERSRELGVLRAIGATRRALLRMLLLEGGAAAALSAVLAVALSVPLSTAVGRILGDVGLHVTLPLVISPLAVIGWGCLAAIVTVAAGATSAAFALRLPVRDVLAYE